ncbi:MAG: 4-hydroxy-tetrahydrodipicolinate reductase [Lachnospiraceae bacterium]|jgi:4-hydroxy-tetrahydrodipicolinate reductase|nr:4-hydroxy-tetrahydrodipicolinate reductase [Lachnospiraceae bacterium]
MIRVVVHGCNGRMGQVVTNFCREDDEVEVVAGIDVSDHIQNDYPVYKSLWDCKEEMDAIIDFASSSAVDALLEYSVEKQVPVVLCTTGLSEEQIQKAEEAAKKTAVLRSANMSLAVNTLMDLLKRAAQVLAPAGFDMEIVDKHHNQKVDAPSGTALTMAKILTDTLNQDYEYKYDRTKDMKKRGKNEIGIHSVRGGNIVGEHTAIFAGTDEVFELKHTAYSRNIFAKGAVEAAKFLSEKKTGYYNMSDVIKAAEK